MEGRILRQGRRSEGDKDVLEEELEEDNRRQSLIAFFFRVPDRRRHPGQRFCKEVITWKSLQHHNVLPLVGVMMSEDQFAMVSDWMVNGNINEFIEENPDADRLGLVGLSFEVLLEPLNDRFSSEMLPRD